MNKICIVITTFLRDELLYKSIQSIVDNYQSNWQLIIIDQNNESENLTFKKIFKSKLIANYVSFEWIHVPYNSGLSYGRNIGVQKAKELDCEYVVIWSDSFLANESLNKINYLVENQLFGYDLIGFELKGSICGWEAKINLIPTKAFQLEFIKKEQQFSKHPEFLLLDCELCRNIFIAKTDTLLSSPWDNNLLLAEHEDFFWQYKQKGYKVGWTNLIVADKMKDRPDEYAELRRINFNNGQKYLKEKYKIKGWVEYINLDEAKKGY